MNLSTRIQNVFSDHLVPKDFPLRVVRQTARAPRTGFNYTQVKRGTYLVLNASWNKWLEAHGPQAERAFEDYIARELNVASVMISGRKLSSFLFTTHEQRDNP